MIFAAGLGTRLKPLTDIIPKALVPVEGKPMIQRVLERVDGKGNVVVINTHHHSDQIINYVNTTRKHWASNILISDETEDLLETGGGIKKAKTLFTNSSPILIHNCDILSNADLDKLYSIAKSKEATLLVSNRKTSRYLIFDNDMRLVGWTNISTGEIRSPYKELQALNGMDMTTWTDGTDHSGYRLYAFSGIHVISKQLVDFMSSWPDKFPIMDFYLEVCKEHPIYGIVKPDLQLLDIGKLDTLDKAKEFITNNL